MKQAAVLLAALMLLAVLSVPPAMAGEIPCEELSQQKDQTIQMLARDNTNLLEKIKTLESTPVISGEVLAQRNLQILREIAQDAKARQKEMAGMEEFVSWMAATINGWVRYLEGESAAAALARSLPVPHAGQASPFSTFASQALLSLNTTSEAVARYQSTAQQFIDRAESFEPGKLSPQGGVTDLALFADAQLLKEMDDTRQRLTAAAEISASTLSFFVSLSFYAGSGEGEGNGTRPQSMRIEVGEKERGFLGDSVRDLRIATGSFAARLSAFDEMAGKNALLIRSVVVYDELFRELSARTWERFIEPVQ